MQPRYQTCLDVARAPGNRYKEQPVRSGKEQVKSARQDLPGWCRIVRLGGGELE